LGTVLYIAAIFGFSTKDGTSLEPQITKAELETSRSWNLDEYTLKSINQVSIESLR